MSDRQFLLLLRVILVTFTVCALLFALNSTSTMYEMVQNAYNVTLTGAFVPLMAGAFWRRANTQGALLSVLSGVGTWLALTLMGVETMVPANLWGLFASVVGMLLGSLLPSFVRNQGQSVVSALHHASGVHHGTKDARMN